MERPGHRRRQQGRKASRKRHRRRASRGRQRHYLHLDRLSFRSKRRVEDQGRQGHVRQLARGPRRQRQRRRHRLDQEHPELHRLRRTDLRRNQQNPLWQREERCRRIREGLAHGRQCGRCGRRQGKGGGLPRFHHQRTRQALLSNLQLYVALDSRKVLRSRKARRSQGLPQMGLGRWPELWRKPVLCEASKGTRGEGIEGHQQDSVTPAAKVATTSTTVPSAGPVAGSRSFLSRLREGDEIARIITFLFAASVVLVTLLLVFELWQGSVLPRHKFGFNFFRTSVWDPIFDHFGALPFIYGTLVTSAVSLLIAVPPRRRAALFLSELAPPTLSDTLEFFIDLLAAVPSVIYGLLGVFIVVPFMRP